MDLPNRTDSTIVNSDTSAITYRENSSTQKTFIDITREYNGLSNITPLSLIFFGRKHDPVSEIINKATEKTLRLNDIGDGVHDLVMWSHVGIIINKRVCPSLSPLETRALDNDDTMYLWESTYSTKFPLFKQLERVLDAETGKPAFGVQIRRLDDVINAAIASGVAIGVSNSYSAGMTFTKAHSQHLDMVKMSFAKRRYTTNPFKLYSVTNENQVVSLVNDSVSQYLSRGTVFSSQFVTLILQSLNLIPPPPEVGASTMLPMELAYPKYSDNSRFKAAFGDKVQVKVLIAANPSASLLGDLLYSTMRKIVLKLYDKNVRKSLKDIIDRLPINPAVLQIAGEILTNAIDNSNDGADSGKPQ